MRNRIYISLDVEADGPVPGLHSMLQLGAVAYTEAGEPISEWSGCFKPLDGALPDPRTMTEFWNAHPGLLDKITAAAQEPAEQTKAWAGWLDQWDRKDVRLKAVCWPASFDLPWIHYYALRFCGHAPLGFSAIDIGSYAAGALGKKPGVSKADMPKALTDGLPAHTHDALEDAREQGELFFRILRHATEPSRLRADLARREAQAKCKRSGPQMIRLTAYDTGHELWVPAKPGILEDYPRLDTTNGKPGAGTRVVVDGVDRFVRERTTEILDALDARRREVRRG